MNKKIVIFKQKIFYYKFNLLYKDLIWHGSRACKKKDFISPQWLRNVRHRKYPFWRLDIFFSKKKYNKINYIENGGWHFTNIKSAEDLEKKFQNFLHHQDFEASGLNLEDIKEKKPNFIIYKSEIDIYHDISKQRLYLVDNYIKRNYTPFEKYKHWEIYKIK